ATDAAERELRTSEHVMSKDDQKYQGWARASTSRLLGLAAGAQTAPPESLKILAQKVQRSGVPRRSGAASGSSRASASRSARARAHRPAAAPRRRFRPPGAGPRGIPAAAPPTAGPGPASR